MFQQIIAIILSITSITLPISKTAVALSTSTENVEQYELKINETDSHVTATHVELLPDDNGKYWIPKGYKVKVVADCEEGYEQSTGKDTYTLDETKTVAVGSSVAPPKFWTKMAIIHQ